MIISGPAFRLVAASSRSRRPGTGQDQGRAAKQPPRRPAAAVDGGRDRHPGRAPRDRADFDEPMPLPALFRVAAAARAFEAGNGYLTGLIVDRFA